MSNLVFQWNPADYARNSQGQERWARELLRLAAIQPHESVLDLGCGDGRITAEIAGMVPEGRVLGVDRSPDMIDFANEQFPARKYPNLSFRRLDARELSFASEFHVVYSSAVLHWVKEHVPVLNGIARGLRPHGRCILQMGGKGNTMDVVRAFEQCFQEPRWREAAESFQFPYNFYDAAEYRPWLEQAGLIADSVELLERDMVHADRKAFTGWLRTAWIPFHTNIPDNQRDEFLKSAADYFIQANPLDSEGQVHVHAVRLQVLAHKR